MYECMMDGFHAEQYEEMKYLAYLPHSYDNCNYLEEQK